MDKNQCKYLILENSNIKRCKIYNYCKQGKCHCFEDKDEANLYEKKMSVFVTFETINLINKFKDFEDAMAKVSTILDEKKASIDKLKELIFDLSNQTGISASEIANDIYNAILAGQDTAKILDIINNRIGSTNKDERIIPDVIINDHPSLADIEHFFGEE